MQSSPALHRISLEAIAEAAAVVDPVFLHSPQYECEPLADRLGCRLVLKVETANPIRSFKGRGADYFLARADLEPGRPIVCASAGNFGQAMAYAGRRRSLEVTVFAAVSANPMKVEAMRRLGAEVRQEGEDFDAAKGAARDHAVTTGGRMVEDGREVEISEGAGSIAVEITEAGLDPEVLTIPVGNGALITGMARWLKAARPGIEVIGVCARGADAMAASWRSGRVVARDSVDTIADGIAVRVPVPEAVADMKALVDDVVVVGDEEMMAATRLLFDLAGQVSEPAGAAGVAAMLSDPGRFLGRSAATVLCGSNLDPEAARRLLARSASRFGSGGPGQHEPDRVDPHRTDHDADQGVVHQDEGGE